MVETVQEFIGARGGVGVLILLSTGPMRFNELADELPVSTSTLDKRLDEGRDLGLVTTKWQEDKKPHEFQYWITERGKFLVRKMERVGMVHPYLTMIDLQSQVKNGKGEIQSWLGEDEVRETLARCADDDPYVDEFGEDITGQVSEGPKFEEDVLIRDTSLGDNGKSDSESDSNPQSEQ